MNFICKKNCCQWTGISYTLPGLFLVFSEEYLLATFFLMLSLFAFLNHQRPYTEKALYDSIDIIDRVLITIICAYSLFFHSDFNIVWFSISYMLTVYFLIIPNCQTKQQKQLCQSSFHLITSLSALFVVGYSFYIKNGI